MFDMMDFANIRIGKQPWTLALLDGGGAQSDNMNVAVLQHEFEGLKNEVSKF